MESKSTCQKVALLFLLINIFYFGVIWFLPNISLQIMQSRLEPLTRLWLINLVTFLGVDPLRNTWFINPVYSFALLFAVNIAAFLGLLLNRNWGRRIFTYILLSMCVWGVLTPHISSDATQAMEVYMQRAYNAWIYDHYWQPLKFEYCKNCESPSQKMTQQYEPEFYSQPLSSSYKDVQSFLESKFSDQGDQASLLAPAYWGIFRVSYDTFKTTKEMYQILFSLSQSLFYLWFLIIPVSLLYFFHIENIKSFFKVGKDSQISGMAPGESLLDSIMENLASGIIIVIAQMCSRWGLFSNILFIYLCYMGHTLSFKSVLKHSKYFWLYGLCFIAAPILFLGANYRITASVILDMGWKYLLIYGCCFWGGLRGYRFRKDSVVA